MACCTSPTCRGLAKSAIPAKCWKRARKSSARSWRSIPTGGELRLGLKQLANDPWSTDIPSKYQPGQVITGKVTKITNFGVFVGLEDGLEGLLHISELSDQKVENPEDVVNVGDELEVKILRVDTEDRKIGLSRRRVEWNEEKEAAENAKEAAASAGKTDPSDLKGGLGASGPLISPNLGADKAETVPATPNAGGESATDE